jgi:hypothetical protein
VLCLHVTRKAVSIEGPDHERETTRALVALRSEGGRLGIVSVGEEEAELRQRLAEARDDSPLRGLRARILAASATEPAKDAPLRVLGPGEDPFWDSAWQDPYALRTGDPSRSRELLLIAPLSEASWSPHLAQGLLMYVLWTSPWTRDKTWPAFRRPPIELRASDDIGGLHYAELVDELRNVWGQERVRLPPGRSVAPPPPTRLQRAARIGGVLFWLALGASFVAANRGAQTLAVALALVSLGAFLVRRVAAARAKVERPRRLTASSPADRGSPS